MSYYCLYLASGNHTHRLASCHITVRTWLVVIIHTAWVHVILLFVAG